jgi:peptidyl-prolyl cis-trans isomerase SurA
MTQAFLRLVPAFSILVATGLIGPLPAVSPVHAQALVATVNGDPLTSIDVEQRMKLLRVMKKPATKDAAVESLISDRLKLKEVSKYGMNVRDNEIGPEIARVASDMKMGPEALLAALEHGGVAADHYRQHFRADYAFVSLIRALNKGVEASEQEVRAELTKDNKAGGDTEYTVRQVIFTLPSSGGAAAGNARMQEAEQLRTRFTSCETGLPLARSMSDVAVQEPLIRTSSQLNDGLRQLLDKTPIGHLTPPSRGSAGLEMLALCNRKTSKDNTAAREAISNKLITARMDAEANRRFKDLRARAVIEKR